MPRTRKAPPPPPTPEPSPSRATIIFASHTWRDRLAQELVATAGLGHDQAKLVAVRVLKSLIAGPHRPEQDDAT